MLESSRLDLFIQYCILPVADLHMTHHCPKIERYIYIYIHSLSYYRYYFDLYLHYG